MIKQVIVIRKDLNMRRGKEIAQGSHSSIAFITKRLRKASYQKAMDGNAGLIATCFLSDKELEWIDGSFTKVCLKVNSEQELIDIYDKAKDAGLEVNMIEDSGRTEFGGVPTKTCLAIGPDESDEIDKITGHLILY